MQFAQVLNEGEMVYMKDVYVNKGKEKVELDFSKLSKTAFVISICSYSLVLIVIALNIMGQGDIITILAPFILIMSFPLSIVLSIVDLCKKNRRKALSIVTAVISSLYFIILITIAVIFFE